MAQVLSSRGKLGKSLKYWCFWMMELKGNLLYWYPWWCARVFGHPRV